MKSKNTPDFGLSRFARLWLVPQPFMYDKLRVAVSSRKLFSMGESLGSNCMICGIGLESQSPEVRTLASLKLFSYSPNGA